MNAASRLFLLGAMLLSSGCAHSQLRYQTVHQANTLNEIYEKQVLDNLAMFTVNPQAIPFFAYPNEGGTQVSGNGTLTGTSPLNPFFTHLGFELNRGMQDSWTLTPVADPRKLHLMRCAYQRAVGVPGDDCNHCCEREKEFLGKPDLWIPVVDRNGKALIDPKTKDRFIDPDTQQYAVDEANKVAVDPATGLPKLYIRQQQYDCDHECAIGSGWLCQANHFHHVPKCCGTKYGQYCGTYIWVHPHFHDQFARLVLTILDFAVNTPAQVIAPTKKITLYVDQLGHATTESLAYGTVEAEVAIDEPVRSVLAQRLTVDDLQGTDLRAVQLQRAQVTQELSNLEERYRRELTELVVPEARPMLSPQLANPLHRPRVDANQLTNQERFAELQQDFSREYANKLGRLAEIDSQLQSRITPPAPFVVPRSPTNTGDSINVLRLRQRQNILSPSRPQAVRP